MSWEMIINNAQVVLRKEIFEGSIGIRDGKITGLNPTIPAPDVEIDFNGDFCIPGLVDLHTDNLEKHLLPRPGVVWPIDAAVLAHDAQMAFAGVTTTLDAIRLGDAWSGDEGRRATVNVAKKIEYFKTREMLRSDHFFHIRCEISNSNVLEEFEYFAMNPLVRLVSQMDHTVGQRQFVDEKKYRSYYQGKYSLDDKMMEQMITQQKIDHLNFSEKNRAALVEKCKDIGLPLASHDDANKSHIEMAEKEGVKISEFPTTMIAATSARDHGLKILMGTPNLILGGSHSGNVAAMELAKAGLLDILASDYVPESLLQGAFILNRVGDIPLPTAISMISSVPARMAGFNDRGEIKIGLRADLLRIRLEEDIPRIISVWRGGAEIH